MEQRNSRNSQLNLNTLLLTGCLALSAWILYSINDLDQKISAQAVEVNGDHEAIYGNNGINKVIIDQSKTIEEQNDRLIKLETLETERK